MTASPDARRATQMTVITMMFSEVMTSNLSPASLALALPLELAILEASVDHDETLRRESGHVQRHGGDSSLSFCGVKKEERESFGIR